VNLLEKQLSSVYFNDVRFPWVTLYIDGCETFYSISHNKKKETSGMQQSMCMNAEQKHWLARATKRNKEFAYCCADQQNVP
jgi:hypothetical protein